MIRATLVVSVFCAAACLAMEPGAQVQSLIVPPWAVNEEGNSLDQEPFGNDTVHHLQYVDASYLAAMAPGSMMTAIAYRADTDAPGAGLAVRDPCETDFVPDLDDPAAKHGRVRHPSTVRPANAVHRTAPRHRPLHVRCGQRFDLFLLGGCRAADDDRGNGVQLRCELSERPQPRGGHCAGSWRVARDAALRCAAFGAGARAARSNVDGHFPGTVVCLAALSTPSRSRSYRSRPTRLGSRAFRAIVPPITAFGGALFYGRWLVSDARIQPMPVASSEGLGFRLGSNLTGRQFASTLVTNPGQSAAAAGFATVGRGLVFKLEWQ